MAALDTPFEAEDFNDPEEFRDQQELTAHEQALRDLFVAEYMNDFDQVAAAQRCGFQYQFAVEFATRFMREPYVLRKIQQIRMTTYPAKETADYEKNRIKAALLFEAHNRGPGSSHAARVAALTRLAAIYGLEAPKKVDQTVTHRGGVMAVPGIAALDDWEKQASASQDQLVAHARE